ncbi:hypothetical protein [Sinomonas susongensis]|uniref:hypothetical protein n=1 Tax=Sinomonas susongensis TaxID=1324851 RepID=UPI0011092BA2|nr:hypothetical protein [Sinomonas susongensis]
MAVSRFPKSWRTDIVVLRGGGRDAKGNPLPVQEIPVTDCLLAPRGTAEPLDRTNGFDSSAVLYHDPDPGLVFLASDRIKVPEGARMAGTWSVTGRPGEWPHGWEVGLERA